MIKQVPPFNIDRHISGHEIETKYNNEKNFLTSYVAVGPFIRYGHNWKPDEYVRIDGVLPGRLDSIETMSRFFRRTMTSETIEEHNRAL